MAGWNVRREQGLEDGITMSLWTRIANVFRSSQIDQDIDEELASHFQEARDRGRDFHDTRKAFGSPLRSREAAHDAVVLPWLESLLGDIRFGWRQVFKHKTASAVAVLSLALGIGSCIATFRLMDSILYRPLPVDHPEQLRVIGIGRQNEFGRQEIGYSSAYEPFQVLRAAVEEQAELLAINAPYRTDITYSTDEQMEKAFRQYVSGWMFKSFALQPHLGRLLNEQDESAPGASPYAVLSFHYWAQRFGKDPAVIGRIMRAGNDVLQIVGVAPEGFTGTEPGVMTDFFVPLMMNKGVTSPDSNWFRQWVRLKPGADPEIVRQRLQAALHAYRTERAKTLPAGTPRQRIEGYVNAELVFESATAGVSDLQRSQRVSLIVLGIVAGLVLLIACMNVASLMASQTQARAREMALRVSIGAAQGRLVRLVLVESSITAIFASAIGLAFAWWSAPFVASLINPPSDPIRLTMPFDLRVAAFGVALTFGVTLLFGLAPALRASGVKPAAALRGGLPSGRIRMNWLVAAQIAFCFLVCLVSGLFVSTFQRMTNQPLGFSADRVLTLDTVSSSPRSVDEWYSAAERLRSVPGVDASALSQFALMSGSGINLDVAVPGKEVSDDSPWFLGVSPGWLETMKIPLLEGRDFRVDDAFPNAVAVNRTFAKKYFNGENPVGRSFDVQLAGNRNPVRIVALTDDARYTGMREPIAPTVYMPFRRGGPYPAETQRYTNATLTVRTQAGDPMSLASALRSAVSQSAPGFRVANIRTQEELVGRHTLRERLLATVSAFFAFVAVVLAGVGLYGTLNQSVLRRRREFGIRVALGASPADVVGRLVLRAFGMAALGVLFGIVVSLGSEGYIRSLLYEVRAADPLMLAIPLMTILLATALAALPPVIRAMRTDPAQLLRLE